MNVILIIGFFMSLFLILLIIGKKSKIQADRYLACMLIIYALAIGGAYIEEFNRGNNYPYPNLLNIGWLFLFLHGPFLWLYIKSLTVHHFKIKLIYALHLVPFTVFLILQYFSFFKLPGSEKIIIAQNELFLGTAFFRISVAAIGLSSISYNIWALILIQKHRNVIEDQYSNLENIDLKWFKTLTVASLIVFSVNVFLFNLNNIIHFAGYYELSQIVYVFATVYVLFLGYFGIKQGRIFVDLPNPEIDHPTKLLTQDIPETRENKEFIEIVKKLTELMELEQPWLDPEISLLKLSSLISVKPETLSEVLNSALGQNFFEYINKYRIEEFKIQCLNKDKKHLSIMGIAYECGFNSKAAFYRAFSKFEGISPTAYISKVS